ncbi:MAG: DUF4956 domain-containing protein [Marinilabiliales bacterium]|nr:MAG: DUF4956 domain-containing protein [Marinilabiliales bacterium]
MDLIKISDFLELVIRFSFNMLVLLVITRLLYYSITKRKDYFFTYLMVGIVVFLLCFLLENVKVQLGFALGLFAIFGILRYRTNPIPIREMTYLFVVIGVSVINALVNKKISYAEMVFTNMGAVVTIWLFERVFFLRHLSVKNVLYEKIDLIKPEKYQELKADLEERTGITIHKIEIGKIDFLRDSARLQIYYFEHEINRTDQMEEITNDDDDD